MKQMLFLALVLVAGGCAPLSIYHREGVRVAQMQADTTTCQVQALRDVPVANSLRRGPPRYVPGGRVCRSDGTCYSRGGFYLPGEIYTVDVNLPLRRRVEAQCMAARGYAPVTVPPCPGGVSRRVPPGQTEVLPALTPRSCVVRQQGGGWRIVTRAQ
ncbi:hypothetical protein [Sulfitobacter sabulilitoris]|uniref:Lipoprotein n=1 Tax=Sulfitobacter sabulilitoris TaxID=2562655 RepID=A0A5S3PJU1_9RHOB|nr:hypothetical protein [Sulfitobacter sabulilitoris]TMM54526.1 hypothetical protein FDT80_02725 [Sulfitobacter sabulilitoris]